MNHNAIWRNQDHDEPVTVVGELGEIEGTRYFAVAESIAGIPEAEIEFVDRTDGASLSDFVASAAAN